jgi:isoleucyl-tRNA synthetase
VNEKQKQIVSSRVEIIFKGNIIEPSETLIGNSKKSIPQCGNDCMRFWITHEYHKTNIPIGASVLSKMLDRVFAMRSILRFLIANTNDYSKPDDFAYDQLYPIDKYIMNRLFHLIMQTKVFYDDLQLNKVLINIEKFLQNDLSSLYIKSVKDRLYCELPLSIGRQSAQYVLGRLLEHCVFLLAPILPNLCQDAYMNSNVMGKLKNKNLFENVYSFTAESNQEWNNPEIMSLFEIIMMMRNEFHLQIRSDNESMFEIQIDCDQLLHDLLHTHFGSAGDSISECFSYSTVKLGVLSTNASPDGVCQTKGGSLFRVKTTKLVNTHACLRCRRYLPTNSNSICKRCEAVLFKLK